MPFGTSVYPGAKDSWPTIAATDLEDDSGKEHDLLHNQHSQAIAALQDMVGYAPGLGAGSLYDQIVRLRSQLAALRAYISLGASNATVDDLQIYLTAQVFGS